MPKKNGGYEVFNNGTGKLLAHDHGDYQTRTLREVPQTFDAIREANPRAGERICVVVVEAKTGVIVGGRMETVRELEKRRFPEGRPKDKF